MYMYIHIQYTIKREKSNQENKSQVFWENCWCDLLCAQCCGLLNSNTCTCGKLLVIISSCCICFPDAVPLSNAIDYTADVYREVGKLHAQQVYIMYCMCTLLIPLCCTCICKGMLLQCESTEE